LWGYSPTIDPTFNQRGGRGRRSRSRCRGRRVGRLRREPRP
jgi:hypothetical protein